MNVDRIDALEVLATRQNEAIVDLVSKVWALSLVNTALLAQLGPAVDRAALRRMALAGLGEGRAHAPAAELIEAFTREPAAALAECQGDVSGALADVPVRLQ